MAIKEIETDDLLATIEEAVWRRRFRDVVRLLVDTNMPETFAGNSHQQSGDRAQRACIG